MSEFEHFIGTREVTDKHAFDPLALTRWLEVNLPGFAGPLTAEMFTEAVTLADACKRLKKEFGLQDRLGRVGARVLLNASPQ